MKLRLILIGCALSVMAFADVSGKWTYETQGRNGPQTATLMLKQDGEKLSGTVSGGRGGDVEISEGMVHGDNVMFSVTREFNGNSVTMKYNGAISGDEMKLTIEGGRGGPQTVTAKRGGSE
jgi:hypothetical protein